MNRSSRALAVFRLGLDQPPRARQNTSQIAQRWKHLIIPIRALRIVGTLLVFDDLLIFAEDVLGEPGDERPRQLDQSWNRRFLHRQVAIGAVSALLGVPRRVAEPHIEHRILCLLDVAPQPYLEALRRVVGADTHVVAEVLLLRASPTREIYDDLFADGLLALGTLEAVLDLRPRLAVVTPDAVSADRAHLLAMHELVVHVEEVLVHEGVVAGHFAVQPAGLVVLAPGRAEARGQAARRERAFAREHEDDPVDFAHWIALHAVRQPLLAEVRHAHARAAAVVGPAVVVTLELIAHYHAEVQRYLAVSAAVLERKHATLCAAVQDDRLAGKAPAERLAGQQLMRPGDRVPIVRVCADAAQVDGVGRVGRTPQDLGRGVFRHGVIVRGVQPMVQAVRCALTDPADCGRAETPPSFAASAGGSRRATASDPRPRAARARRPCEPRAARRTSPGSARTAPRRPRGRESAAPAP